MSRAPLGQFNTYADAPKILDDFHIRINRKGAASAQQYQFVYSLTFHQQCDSWSAMVDSQTEWTDTDSVDTVVRISDSINNTGHDFTIYGTYKFDDRKFSHDKAGLCTITTTIRNEGDWYSYS